VSQLLPQNHYRLITYLSILLALALSPIQPAQAVVQQATPTPVVVGILSPLPGQAGQGQFPIIVNTHVEGFQFAELSFGYYEDPTQTWFLIAQSVEPVSNAKMAEWDTSTITDGNYTLRLVVSLQDGSKITTAVTGIRVRNYSPIETDTPAPSPTPAPGQTPLPTITPTPTISPIPPTLTPLATNPAQITNQDVTSNFWQGVAIAFVIFLFIGLYGAIRRAIRKGSQ
jgi:hypothetical protein